MEIIHHPFGQEHPYQQLPEERTPRQPLAQEPFQVGIVTRPAGAVKQVTIHTALNGAEATSVTAQHLVDWTPILEDGVGAEYLQQVTKIDQDVWSAALVAPNAGETLTYWIETEHGRTSETYTVMGESWQTGGGIVLDGNRFTVTRTATDHSARAAAQPALHKIEWLTDGQKARRVRLTFAAQADERFFGLGERFNTLDQRGNVMDIRCYEQYKNQGTRAYMPIPFLLSTAGYGVWVESNRWMQFDLAATDQSAWSVEIDLGANDESVALTWFAGDNPLEITGAFAQQTGPVALPPDWTFGLWMSSNEWNSQARVEREVLATEAHDIAAKVLVIEAWSDEATFYIWNDAQYTPKDGSEALSYADFTFPPDGKWTDPKGMTDWLHERGIKLILWQIPTVKLADPHPQHDADRAHFEARKLGVKTADGELYRVLPGWFRGGYVWDPTNEEARDWWFSKRAYLLDEIGVDGFKTDGGEHIWGTQHHLAEGGTDELWNAYPQRYSEAYYNFLNQHREGVIFSRAGYTGSQRAPAHWAGDEHSTWDAYRNSILAGLSAGISGIPFWGWDIGGFSGKIPTAELYLRSTAMAAFCPVMQYHSEFNNHVEPNNDRTPWNIQSRTEDGRVIPVFRHFVNVRHNLMPYIWQEAQHSAQTGQPMMQALKLWHPEASDYQYFFGRDLLVSPIVEENATSADIYLPAGDWFDLWTGARVSGGQVVTVTAEIDQIPVFVRAGASIPVLLGEAQKLGDSVPFSTESNHTLTFA